MEVLYPQTEIRIVLGEVFSHPLREGRHEDPLTQLHPLPQLSEEIIHLGARSPYLDCGIHEACRTNNLFHHATAALLKFIFPWRSGDVDGPVYPLFELFEPQGSVVERGREPESVFNKGPLPRPVAVVHASNLGDGDVTLIDDEEEIVGKVVDEGIGRLPRYPPREVAGVVFDTRTVPHLLHHLEVVHRPLLKTLRLDKFIHPLEGLQPLPEFHPYVFYGALHIVPCRNVVARRVYEGPVDPPAHLSPHGVNFGDCLDRIAEELHSHRCLPLIGGEDLYNVPTNPEGTPMEVVVIPFVLHLHEPFEDIIPYDIHPSLKIEVELAVVGGRADAVDT